MNQLDEDDVVEFVTVLRGREVRCRLVAGQLEGDEELLRRVRRVDPLGRAREPLTLLKALPDAVGSTVSIRWGAVA